MKNMLLLLIAYFVFPSANGQLVADASQRISIVNESVWDIKAIYISQPDKNEWKENLLNDELLSAGGGAVIAKAVCGTYDIKVVDADNQTCIISKADLCNDNSKSIVITDESISKCLNN